MREPVQEGPGQSFILSKDLWPICKRQIGRYDQAGLFVALAEEANRDMEPPRGGFPPTPPDVRVRIRRFE